MFPQPDTKLNTHPLWREAAFRQCNILPRVSKMKMNGQEHLYEFVYDSPQFSDEDKFALKAAALLQEIMFKIDKTQYCYFLLDKYPFRGVWNAPMVEGEYIEHEMEAHLVQIDGLFDRIFDFVNYIFDLKAKRKDVPRLLKGQTIYVPLNRMVDFFLRVRRLRNTVVHEYRFDDPAIDLNSVVTDDIVIRSKYLLNQGEGSKKLRNIDVRYAAIIELLQREMCSEQERIEKYLCNILDECTTIYFARINIMRNIGVRS